MTFTGRVAVVGLGSIGLRRARTLIELGVAVFGFDPNIDSRRKLAAIGGTACGSREAALRSACAAVIASPSRFHLDDLGAAIEHGCHAFIEKPLGHDLDLARRLVACAADRQLLVFPALNLRYHPCVELAKAALDSGTGGHILWARAICSSYLPAWRPEQDYRKGYAADARTGGIVFDDIHELDLLLALLGPGEVVASVARNTGLLALESDDCADIIVRHRGGVVSTLHMDFVTRPRQRVTEIAGSTAFFRIDVSNRRFTQINPDGVVELDENVGGSVADDYRRELADFIDCVDGRSRPRCHADEAIVVLEQVVIARAMAGLPS